MFEVRVEAGFEAGHHRGPDGEELPLHHHQWQVAARACSEDLDHIGLVIDFRVLRAAIDEVLGELDQRVLEDIDAFADVAPTAPVVAGWIFNRLDTRLGEALGFENGTEPDRGHHFWLDAIEVEADAGTRFEYRRPRDA
jgi:6-pyruvoyltetrahydropterin/6-carboxytetrahydropterin synthase